MRTIAELLNKHQGEEAWIFGKGPSLDSFDFRSAGPLRICINESLLHVPDPTYFFAHDEIPIQNVASRWLAACSAILQPVRGQWAQKCGIPAETIYAYEKRDRELDILNWSAEQIARKGSLLGLTGTVHSALHFCRLIGTPSIVFVGMDGGLGYARCTGQATPLGGGQHDLIRRDSINIAGRLGLQFRFEQGV